MCRKAKCNLFHIDGTDDYIPVTNVNFTFPNCDVTLDCTMVDVVDDCIIEEREEIDLRLFELPGQDPRVKVGAGKSLIEINDDTDCKITWCIL